MVSRLSIYTTFRKAFAGAAQGYWRGRFFRCNLTGMPTTLELEPNKKLPNPAGLKWYQGLDRYCWIVLLIAALGWLFDTMDQNLMNIVRVPSLNELLYKDTPAAQLTDEQKADVKKHGGYITSIFLLGWAAGGFVFGVVG